MSVEYFLDTNIIVYSFDAMAPAKADMARALIGKSLRERDGTISWQVVQEFCNLALRKFASPMTPQECDLYMRKALFPCDGLAVRVTLFGSPRACRRNRLFAL